jgi:hypothetical protein
LLLQRTREEKDILQRKKLFGFHYKSLV